jgi:YidC/Oxa1 family membrane protein insertase
MLVSLGIVLGYNYLTASKPSAQPVAKTTEKAPAKTAAPEKVSTPGLDKPSSATLAPPELRVSGGPVATADQPILLGSDLSEADYDLAAEVVPRGAAVRQLTLSRHRFFRTVVDRAEATDDRAAMALIEPPSPPAFTIPELRVRLKGSEAWSTLDLSDSVWKVVAIAPDLVTLEIAIEDAAGKPVLKLRKTFFLAPRSAAAKPGLPQYELQLKVEVESASAVVDKVTYALAGPPALPIEGVAGMPAGMVRGGTQVMPAVGGRGGAATAVRGSWADRTVTVEQLPAKDVKRGEALPEMKAFGSTDLAWVGEMDKYFAIVMIPQPPAVEGTFVAGAESVWYRASSGQTDQAVPMARVLSRELSPAAGETVSHEFAIFAGPKDDGLLEKLYGPLGLTKLIAWSSPCCFVPLPGIEYLSRFLVGVLEAFHYVVANYGLAIILLVVLLRVVLHPITRWSTRSMVEMQKLQPKMQEIREKYANDKQKMQEEMQKMGGMKMFGGCLPMFLQMPIWIALYTALGVAIQLRHASFLPADWLPAGSMFLQDLSAPDMMLHWQTPLFLPGLEIPVLGWILGAIQGMLAGGAPGGGITTLNVLPILLGVSMYLQQKFSPQAPSANPQMASQRKMMNLMSIFFALILYSAPAGLNLYIATSTFLGVLEQRYIKKNLAAEEKLKEVLVLAGGEPAAPGKTAKQVSLVAGRRKSLGERLQAWMQRKMEEGRRAREDAERKGRRGK